MEKENSKRVINEDFIIYKNSITEKISKKANIKIEQKKDFPNLIFEDEKLFLEQIEQADYI